MRRSATRPDAAPPPAACGGPVFRLVAWIRRSGLGLPVTPSADHQLLIDEGHEYGRAKRQPAPIHNPFIKLSHGLAQPALGAEFRDPFREPFGILAEPQRRRQELFCEHALSAHPIPQPGRAEIRLSRVGKGLTLPRQIIEKASLLRLVNLLINPRGKAHPRRFTLRHADTLSLRAIVVLTNSTGYPGWPLIKFSPTGRLLNLHAQMAHSPALLAAYVSMQRAIDQHATLDLPARWGRTTHRHMSTRRRLLGGPG